MKLDLAGSRKRPRLVFTPEAAASSSEFFLTPIFPVQLSMRILIVDDEPGIRKTTRIAIETAGHQAAEAPNSARALKALEEEPFDVAFVDLKLGTEDGHELLAKLLPCRAFALGRKWKLRAGSGLSVLCFAFFRRALRQFS